ncbi:MAG: ribosome biogenesis GTP-binding protein YihA/YsxC [Methyloligellaceae bacterium]
MNDTSNPDYESGRKLFSNTCNFIKGVVSIDDLPAGDRMEVAFAGRSNVGKSSLINALCNRKNLARTSNTPGRTREINFFELTSQYYIVDLPGYGYARVSKSTVSRWTALMKAYLRGRTSLRRVFVLIDSRHGLKKSDLEFCAELDTAAVSYQCVLTKIDKIKRTNLEKTITATEKLLAKHPAAFPEILVTSSQKNIGLDELRETIASMS